MRGNEIFAEDLFRLASIVFSVFESLTGRDGFDGCAGFPEWASPLAKAFTVCASKSLVLTSDGGKLSKMENFGEKFKLTLNFFVSLGSDSNEIRFLSDNVE